MPLNWMKNIRNLPIDSLLLLEKCHLEWIPTDYHRREWAIVFRLNPHIAYFIEHKYPPKAKWVDDVQAEFADMATPGEQEVSRAYGDILQGFEDWIIYTLDPRVYDVQPHNGWDERELTGLIDFTGKRVIDIGSGTGKQAFAVAGLALAVYCVEPVENLRAYLREEAARRGFEGVYVLDGRMTELPFEDGFADVITSGHVFGDEPQSEYDEMMRVLKPGGVMILIPGNNDRDNDTHRFLTARGCGWSRFEEPGDGIKRKYWKRKS